MLALELGSDEGRGDAYRVGSSYIVEYWISLKHNTPRTVHD